MWRIFVSKIKAMDNTFEKTVNYSVPNSDIKIINYSPVSIAVIGYTKHIKTEIEAIGGKPNFRLHIGDNLMFGWIFPLTKLALVKSLLTSEVLHTSTEVVIREKSNTPVIKTPTDILPTDKKVRYTKKLLENYLISNIPKLLECIGAEMKIGSIVMNDTNFLPDDGKRYLFLGAGCGFSHLDCDKRNPLGKKIIQDSLDLRDVINKKLISCIEPAYLKKLEQSDNPIQAHLAQNLNYKCAYNYIVVRVMEYFDIKKINVRNFDD